MSCETIQSFEPIKFGETWGPKVINIEDSDNPGTFLDLTNWTILIELRKRPNEKVFHTFVTSTSGIDITLEPNGWDIDIPDYIYRGDVFLIDPNGKKYSSNEFLLPIGESISKL